MKEQLINKKEFPFKGNLYDLPLFTGEYFNVLRDKEKNILIDKINLMNIRKATYL